MKHLMLSLLLVFSFSAQASISISPAWVNFGNVSIQNGFSGTQFVTIFNNNHRPASLNVIPEGCFEFNVGGICYDVPGNGSCNLEISFHPTQVGPSYCTINLQDLSTESFGTIEVNGTGTK